MAVKGVRSYDNRLRAQQAGRTRAAVLDAAHRLLVERGYAATSVRDIAEAAGVSFPTVYAAVGNKPAILSALWDIAVAGDDEPVPMAERAQVRAAEADPDPRGTLAVFAHQITAASARTAPLLRVIDEAAGASPEIAALAGKTRAELHAGVTRLARNLHRKGVLRPDLTVAKAADILWMLAGGVVHHALVEQREWSSAEAEEWLATSLGRLLLTD
jgi:AcrR family transcriptional regulator